MNLFHDVCFHYQKHIKYPTKFISMQMKFESLNRCPTLYYFVTSGFMTSKMVVLASQRALSIRQKIFPLKMATKTCCFFCNEFLTPRLSNVLYLATKPQTFHKSSNNSLWKRVIAWERSRAASGYGIIWGDADRNKQEEFSAESHSVDYF